MEFPYRLQRKIPKLSNEKLLKMVRGDMALYNTDVLRSAFGEIARRKNLSDKKAGTTTKRPISKWSSVAAIQNPSIRDKDRARYFVFLGSILWVISWTASLKGESGLTLSSLGSVIGLISLYFGYELLKSKLESYGKDRYLRKKRK